MSTLTENINSLYIDAYNSLKSTAIPKEIKVYVESEEDIPFWYDILKPHYNEKIYFTLTVPYTENEYIERGKDQVIAKIKNGVGKYMLLCVDSDYDYLLQDHYLDEYKKKKSEEINKNIYILQTYAYSIENLLCTPKDLYSFCVKVTQQSHKPIHIDKLIETYSKYIYKLFLWNLFMYSQGRDDVYSIKKFSKDISFPEKRPKNNDLASFFDSALAEVKMKAEKIEDHLIKSFPKKVKEVELLGQDLKKSKGLKEEESFLYIKGHTLMDKVVLKILIPICVFLKNEKMNEYKNHSKTEEQKIKDMGKYDSLTQDMSKSLERLIYNNKFKGDIFLKIENDINSYLESLKHSS